MCSKQANVRMRRSVAKRVTCVFLLHLLHLLRFAHHQQTSKSSPDMQYFWPFAPFAAFAAVCYRAANEQIRRFAWVCFICSICCRLLLSSKLANARMERSVAKRSVCIFFVYFASVSQDLQIRRVEGRELIFFPKVYTPRCFVLSFFL